MQSNEIHNKILQAIILHLVQKDNNGANKLHHALKRRMTKFLQGYTKDES